MARHPAYKDSALVQNAATASRFIVTTTGYLANAMTTGADSFTKKTKPNPRPMNFTPTTQERIRKLNSVTGGAVKLSAKTVGQVTKHAQNVGATLARRGEQKKKGVDNSGRPIDDYKPGLLNKSMMAFSTIADGIDHASRNLLNSGSTAATQVVGHRYGEDARNVAGSLAGGIKNVGLVYVDAAGVSRRAIVKSVAKGMVRVAPSFVIGSCRLTRFPRLLAVRRVGAILLSEEVTGGPSLQRSCLRTAKTASGHKALLAQKTH